MMTTTRALDFASIRLNKCLQRWAYINVENLDTQEQLENAACALARRAVTGMSSKTYAELLVVCGLLHWANECELKISNNRRKRIIEIYAKLLYSRSRFYGNWYDNAELVLSHINYLINKWF